MNKRFAIGLAASLALCATAGPAEATFPGKNGLIAAGYQDFSRYPGYINRSRLVTVHPRTRGTRTRHACEYWYDGRRAGGCSFTSPRYSPDGSTIAVSYLDHSTGRAGVALMEADGSAFRVNPLSGRSFDLAWSPTGMELVWDQWRSDFRDALVIGFPDGRVRHSLVDDSRADEPDWSARGQIAYTLGDFASEDIYVIRPGGTPRRLTYGGGSDPSWSPDGRWIAFVRLNRLFVVRRNGTGLRRLTRPRRCPGSDPSGVTSPAWSPDGKSIAFIENGSVYVLRRSGRGKRRLRGGHPCGDAGFTELDWQPLPRR